MVPKILNSTDQLSSTKLNFVYERPEMRSKEAGIPGEFPFHQWNYHESIKNEDMGIVTNPLENIYPKLKSKMDRGYLTRVRTLAERSEGKWTL